MENSPKKQQIPAFAVLTIIAVIAALVLAVTNLLTEGPIAQRQAQQLQDAFGAVLAADTYEQVTEGLENQDISSLYVAKDAQGNVIGYTVTASGTGYGGPVAVTLGVDAKGVVTGCVVGDGNFSETAGFGTRALEPAFQEQFKGISAVEGGSFEALTGATRTSNAVLDATNRALTAVAQVCLKKDTLPSPLVSFGVKAAPQVDTSALTPGATLRGEAEGYGGGMVIVTVKLDDNLAIADLKIDASSQTPGFGQRCAEDADWQSAIVGQTLPVTVDALSGATITSVAVQDAINGAQPYEAEEASAPAPQVIAETENATLGVYSDGSAAVAPSSSYTGSLNVTLDVKDGKVQSGTVEAVQPTAEPLPEGALTASAAGFAGDPVNITVTLNDDGTIATLTVDASAQMEGIGLVCEKEEFTSQFIGKKGPFTLGDGIDACTGATFTSQGVVDAVNSLFVAEAPATEATATEAPATEAPATTEPLPENALTASAAGFAGDPVNVTVTLNDDGTIATLTVDASTQMEGIGLVCEKEDFTSQFIGKKGPFTLGDGIDACTGATFTSQGVVDAVNSLFAAEATVTEAPATEAPAIAESLPEGALTASAAGFAGDPVNVTVTLNDDGTIATLIVDASTQMEGIGLVCENEDFTSQFIGEKGPFTLGDGIDACTGATFTSQGVVDAVNSLFEAPAENALTASAAGFAGDPVNVTVTLNDDGTIATLTVDASTQMEGIGFVCEKEDFTSQFIGKKGPFTLGDGIDTCAGATFTSQGVVDAVNSLFAAEPPATEAPATEAPATAEALPEGALTASAAGFAGDPVNVTVTLNDDGTIATLTVDASTQMEGIGLVCEKEDFTSQFIGKKGPFTLGNGIDACTGATFTSQGVVDAVNSLFADAAN